MKKQVLFISIVLLLISCKNTTKTEYSINGNVIGSKQNKVYLKKRDNGNWVNVDSTIIKNEKFTFNGNVKFPEMYFLSIPDFKCLIPFFIENTEITFNINTDSIDNSSVSGSKTHKQYEKYLEELNNFNNKLKNLYSQYKNLKKRENKLLLKNIENLMDSVYNSKEKFTKNYILKNNKTPISPYLAYINSYQFSLSDLDSIINNFDKTLDSSVYVKLLNDRLKILKRVDINQPILNFTMNDKNNKPISTKSFKGKYLLIDFWASWCSPCRAENPNVVKTYNRFHKKGFEILGVSFDQNKEKWLKAIKDDKLIWPQVSDLKGWNNAAGKLYGIRSIPQNVLINKEGIIIAKNLRGEELIKRLNEEFKQ